MSMMDLIRFRLSAWALELSLFLMPDVQETDPARLHIRRACSSLIDALGEDD